MVPYEHHIILSCEVGAMWFRRNGEPVPDCLMVMALDDGTGAIEIEGRKEKVFTAHELKRLNKKRERARKRSKRKAEQIAQFQDDPRHTAFCDRHGELIVEAKKFVNTAAYDKTVVESLAKFNRLGHLTDDEVRELKAVLRAAPPAQPEPEVVPVRLEPRPEPTQVVNTWLGRVGQTIEVRVKVVQAVGIRRWWRQQHVTVMKDTHGNTLVTQGRFLGQAGTELVIRGKVSDHGSDSQTILRRVKVRH